MTKLRAEKITGLAIRRTASGWEAADSSGEVFASVRGGADSITGLVANAYRKRSRQAFLEQGYRCFSCGRIAPLESDHVVKRSKDRSDRRENLRGMCARCHERRHHEPGWTPLLHVAVERYTEAAGLVWGGEHTGWVRGDSQEESKHAR